MTQPRDFGFDDDIVMVRDGVRRFMEEKQPLLLLREQLGGTEDPHRGRARPSWHDARAWREMIELGWHLLAVPEADGGLGLGLVAAAAVQEEVGRAACPTPLTSVLQSTFVLREAGASRLLARVAGGEIMGLAILGPDGSPTLDETAVQAADNRLSGTSWYVQDAGKCDSFVVAARSTAGVGLYHVAAGDVEIRSDRIVDLTRDQARIVLDNVAADVIVPPGEGVDVLSRALPALLTLIAADIAGAAEWQLQATAEYAKTRVQFDRPIGFFQAVKHPIVDMMIAADETRSLTYNAASAFDFDRDDAMRCARLAKSNAADTAMFCANRSTQLHGGIGFTWEMDVQIYHKRQMHSQMLFGDGAWNRRMLAQML